MLDHTCMELKRNRVAQIKWYHFVIWTTLNSAIFNNKKTGKTGSRFQWVFSDKYYQNSKTRPVFVYHEILTINNNNFYGKK